METTRQRQQQTLPSGPHTLGKLIEWKRLAVVAALIFPSAVPTRWGN